MSRRTRAASSRYRAPPTPPNDTDAHRTAAADLRKMPDYFPTHTLSTHYLPLDETQPHPPPPYPYSHPRHAANGFGQHRGRQTGGPLWQDFAPARHRPYLNGGGSSQRRWYPPSTWSATPSDPFGADKWQWQQPRIQPWPEPEPRTQTQWYANYVHPTQQGQSLIRPWYWAVEQQRPQMNPIAPAFTPLNAPGQQRLQSVSSDSICRTVLGQNGVDKHIRYARGGVAAIAPKMKCRKRSKSSKQAEQVASQVPDGQPDAASKKKIKKSKHTDAMLHLLKRPKPTGQYLIQANGDPVELDFSRPLLVVLDLNGTLLFRKKHGGSNAFVARPHVHEFLDYLFSTHNVMVWSSAKPENVAKMCADLFTKEQQDKLVAIWGRDRLGLTAAMYNQRVQVYKQLSWVWSDAVVQARRPWSQQEAWGQGNTVLIDDSVEKAASEPHNLIQIDEFDGNATNREEDLLSQLADYLDALRSQLDVSAYIRSSPFEYEE